MINDEWLKSRVQEIREEVYKRRRNGVEGISVGRERRKKIEKWEGKGLELYMENSEREEKREDGEEIVDKSEEVRERER